MTFKELLEQEQQKLDESLDRVLSWQWERAGGDVYEASFNTSSGREYEVSIVLLDEDDDNYMTFPVKKQPPDIWEVFFRPIDGTVNTVTNQYESLEILSTIGSVLLDFYQAERPDIVLIDTVKDVIDRRSAYLKILLRHTPPEYEIGGTNTDHGEILTVVRGDLIV